MVYDSIVLCLVKYAINVKCSEFNVNDMVFKFKVQNYAFQLKNIYKKRKFCIIIYTIS
jgi:hypothetical protein